MTLNQTPPMKIFCVRHCSHQQVLVTPFDLYHQTQRKITFYEKNGS